MHINTHGLIVDFGKFSGERYTRIPVGYLRWMINADHRCANVARAELARRGMPVRDRDLEISGHALDSASLRLLGKWQRERKPDQGLHAWLSDLFMAAMEKGADDAEGSIVYDSVKFVYEPGYLYPTLKTVIRINDDKENDDGDTD